MLKRVSYLNQHGDIVDTHTDTNPFEINWTTIPAMVKIVTFDVQIDGAWKEVASILIN